MQNNIGFRGFKAIKRGALVKGTIPKDFYGTIHAIHFFCKALQSEHFGSFISVTKKL